MSLSVPIVVTAAGGRLNQVMMRGPSGAIEGSMNEDKSVWTASSTHLEYGEKYRIYATAVDPRGVGLASSGEFITVEPERFFSGVVSPQEGEIVGVGTPITVTFDRDVVKKAEVERALHISTPTPIEGAWSWQSDRIVQFRPRYYWPGDIKAVVSLNLLGVQAKTDVYGGSNSTSVVSFGPSMVTRVNAIDHMASVYRNGEKIRVIPITTGKLGFETRSGIKLILSKERTRVMDAATGGTGKNDPEYYRLLVEYAMRVTYSGEFLHAAPWSVASQGRANASHGCIGMSSTNAQWLYDLSSVGDIVEVAGTGVEQDLGNGITIWNKSWEEWLLGSKAGDFTTNTTLE